MTKPEKQKMCPICNEKLTFLKQTLEGNIRICEKHFGEAGINLTEILSRVDNKFTVEEIKKRIELLKEAKEEADGFVATKVIGKAVAFDDENKQVIVSPNKHARIYDYDHISTFELLEDGETVTSGGLGRALAGGVLFGGAGAIVGGVTGKKKGKDRINSLKIKLSLKDVNHAVDYIDFLDFKTKRGSLLYNEAFNNAQECLSVLQFICDQQEALTETKTSKSAPDEIMKYKNLLDAGAITEEEYESKKKELLGL